MVGLLGESTQRLISADYPFLRYEPIKRIKLLPSNPDVRFPDKAESAGRSDIEARSSHGLLSANCAYNLTLIFRFKTQMVSNAKLKSIVFKGYSVQEA